jgi:FkbM family methyltransferase
VLNVLRDDETSPRELGEPSPVNDARPHGVQGSRHHAERRLRVARRLLRVYPGLRGRWRLASLLLTHSLFGWNDETIGWAARSIPAQRVIRCRYGIRVRVEPDPMYVGPYLFGDYEPATTALIRRLVRPGDVTFDVGANFGWYSALLARLVAGRGEVHAFEPVPALARLARETLSLSGSPPVTLNPVALGRESGMTTIYTFAGLPHGHASLSDLGRADASSHECPITTLDEYAGERDIARVDLIKVDVEGHERDVFLGGRTILSRPDAPIVAFEVNPFCLAHAGLAADDLRTTLVELGYESFWHIAPGGRLRRASGALPDTDADYLAVKPYRRALVDAVPARGASRERVKARV